jgi:hypothetical protein
MLPNQSSPHTSPTNISHFQKLFNRSPDYNFLRIFGCACFPNLHPYNQHEFDLSIN